MRSQLDRLEQRIKNLVEGNLANLLDGQLTASSIASQLTSAMAEVVKEDDEGRHFAPDQYALTLHPEDANSLLKQDPEVHNKLAAGLMEAARSSRLLMAKDPQITIAADPTLARWEIRVVAWHSGTPLAFTHPMNSAETSASPALPAGAFLIVNGKGHFPLEKPVINIGRRLDNQLILDNPHVSRTHAQLRVREGRYVLFDLGSTSGTKINGRKIKEHTLREGDVITIADIRLVYGEDPGGPPDSTDAYTPPFPPRPAGDLRTRGDIRKPDDKG